MNDHFWEEYANNADVHYNKEFAKFIKDLAVSLRSKSILEVGCNAGNDLKLFPEQLEVHGVDSNENIIKNARERLPSISFKVGSATLLPYEDSSMDMIFTHGFFNYLDDKDVSKVIKELFRVSKKYIVNCELFNEEEKPIEEKEDAVYRNMLKLWMEYKVKIISNVDMHEEIDPEQSRFTLVRKLEV